MQLAFDARGGLGIERRGGLVQQQGPRRQRQGARQGGALAFAGGEFLHQRVHFFRRQAQPLEQVGRPGRIGVMGRHVVVPPAGLGLAVDHLAAPLIAAHARARRAVQFHFAMARIEVGHLAQQQ